MDIKKFDIQSLFNKKDMKYPEKTTINLAMTQKKENSKKSIIVRISVAVVILLIFSKFLIFDQVKKISTAQNELKSLQAKNEAMQKDVADYNKILNEYRAYTTDWMIDTAGEKEPKIGVDRKEVIDMVQKEFASKGKIRNVSINSFVDKDGDSYDVLTVLMRVDKAATSSSILKSVRKNKLTKNASIGLGEDKGTSGEFEFTITVELNSKEKKK